MTHHASARFWRCYRGLPERIQYLPIFEYACHEGNYGMDGTLSGARVIEQKSGE